MDPKPPPGAAKAPTRRARSGAAPYRLPGPLSSRGDLPVAPSAPRIPRALRAFNGMPPEEVPAAASPAPESAPRGVPMTMRDLLEEPPGRDVEPESFFAGLRGALRRLRRQQP